MMPSDRSTVTPLWDVDHPYYCSDSNYYVGGVPKELQPRPTAEGLAALGVDVWDGFTPYDHFEFESWSDFGWKDADLDMNLVFRWDWKVPDPNDYGADEDMPPETLFLYVMQQRKGRFVVLSFPVARDEEPEIREWLQGRFEHLLKLWGPLRQQNG
jgi:hypothetical protein